MKPRVFFLVLLFPLVAACVSRTTRDALDTAEALLPDAPDSALAIVSSIPHDALRSHSIRARHALLTTEAQDKCFLDIVEDSTIRVAYDWYKNQRFADQLNRLKSTYYLGVVRQNAGNDIEAAILFREVEPLAEELKEYRWQSLCYQHLSHIYSNNYDRSSAMYYAEESLHAAERAGDSLMAGYCQLDVADEFIAQNKLDSAEVLLKTLIQSHQGDSFLSAYACRSLARLYLFQHNPDFEKADLLYERVVSGKAIPLSSVDYGYLGLLAEKQGQKDSSDHRISMAEGMIQSAVDSVSYYLSRANIFDLRGDIKESYTYYGKAMDIQDRIAYNQLEQSITHAMESHYQTQAALEQEKSRSSHLIFLLCTLSFIGIIFWLIRRLQQAKQEILEKMVQIQDFAKDIENLQSKDSVSRLLLDFYTKDKIKSLNALADAYFSWDSDYVRQKEKHIGNHSKEELVERFQKQLEVFRKGDSFYASLEESLNVYHDGIMARAREVLKLEKKIDFDLVILFFSGFSAKSICFLKDMTEASVRMRKTRLKMYFASLPDNRGAEFVKILDHKE